MPTYEYACPHEGCEMVKDVLHKYSELENPTQETIDETTCPEHGVRMVRQISAPHVANSQGGVTVGEKTLLDQKQQQRKKRSRLHFKNDVLPTLKKSDQRYFKPKYKNISGDHEKM